MRFSIIIPTLNEAETILHNLFVLQPMRTQCEIILVDGGSIDQTTELALPWVDKVISTTQGRARQMNAGAKIATGELLVFLHADTLLPDDALTQIAKAIDNKSAWGRFDVQLSGNHRMLQVVAFLMNWRSRLTGIATGDQVLFVDKPLFDSVGQYPEIALMEDIALSKTLKKCSLSACLSAKVTTSGRRWEEFGVLKTILLMWNLRLRYFWGEDPQVLADLYRRGQFWKT